MVIEIVIRRRKKAEMTPTELDLVRRNVVSFGNPEDAYCFLAYLTGVGKSSDKTGKDKRILVLPFSP